MPGIIDAVISEKYYLYKQASLEKEAAWENPISKWLRESDENRRGYNARLAEEAHNDHTESEWNKVTGKAKEDFKINPNRTVKDNASEIYNLGKEDLKNYFKGMHPDQIASLAGSKLADGVSYAGKHGYRLGKEFGKSFLNSHGGMVTDALASQPWLSEGIRTGIKTFQKDKPLLTGALATAVPLLAMYAGKKGVGKLIRKRASEIYEIESYGFYK